MHPWVLEAEHRVRFGIAGGPRTDWQTALAFVRDLERLGFDSYWRSDHPMVQSDCWTTLAAMALVTERIRLGTLVTCAQYRNPVLLARMAADVDGLSNGRVVLGLGSGDLPGEFAQLGIRYPPIADRQAALYEALSIVVPLLRGEEVTFAGRHFRGDGAVLPLPPVQRPHVPILVAGGGERTTLRYAAEFADVSNISASAWGGGARTPADVTRKFQLLDAHCRELGRASASVMRSTVLFPTIIASTQTRIQEKVDAMSESILAFAGPASLIATPEEAIQRLGDLVSLGFRYFIMSVNGDDRETIAHLVDRVIPKIAGV